MDMANEAAPSDHRSRRDEQCNHINRRAEAFSLSGDRRWDAGTVRRQSSFATRGAIWKQAQYGGRPIELEAASGDGAAW